MSFHAWLNEYIDWFGRPERRKRCFFKFVTHGLMPMVKGSGYAFGVYRDELVNYIANYWYENSSKSCLTCDWNYKVSNTEWSPEDRAHFDFILDTRVWDAFWERWGNWHEASLHTERGQDFRISIQEIVWYSLDLENSAQSDELYEIIAGGEEDSGDYVYQQPTTESKKIRDIYLQEAEMNGWGGYRR